MVIQIATDSNNLLSCFRGYSLIRMCSWIQRHKHEAIQFLTMAAKVDAAASKLQSAACQQQVARAVGQISGQMGKAMESMDVMQVGSPAALVAMLFPHTVIARRLPRQWTPLSGSWGS